MSLPSPEPNEAHDVHNTRRIGTLAASEKWWRDRYNDIVARGYKLRPRYDPHWEPSWIKSRKDFYLVEDGQTTISSQSPDSRACIKSRAVMVAVRSDSESRDDVPIMFKKVVLLPKEGLH
jgi:hypothetical protein